MLAYHRLSRDAEALHGELGLNAGGRSILMTVARLGPQTISDLARLRDVSRQFMQRAIQVLLAAGYLAEVPNPRRRGSSLLSLTLAGEAAIERMRRVEAPLWRALDRVISPDDLAATLRVLGQLREGPPA
ncbi:MarR family winged helix-turn-helix transcriptional regulator [Phenylobacterium sp.]|uniref:MarR family winged helix-turn-helix transcriptional regulator n=1 Tax=Phenylobacterium sp. TaxID=1871053 RepID=UPI003D26B929